MARRSTPTLFLAGLLSLLAALHGASAQPYGSLLELINAHPKLTTLASWVNATGLNVLLSDTNLSTTAFLPTDTAISNFVVNVVGLSAGVSALNVSGDPAVKSAVTKLLKYHLMRPGLTSSEIFNLAANTLVSTFLSVELPLIAEYDDLFINATTTTVGDTYGQFVQLSTDAANKDIPVAGGRAYGNLIDSVLMFWYPNLWKAITNSKLRMYTTALAVASSAASSAVGTPYNWTGLLADPNATYTVFGLRDNAISNAWTYYGVNLTDSSIGSSDILNYHISTTVYDVDPYSDAEIPAGKSRYNGLSQATDFPLTLSIEKTAKPSIRMTGFSGTVNVVVAQIPVGGLLPKAYLTAVDDVLYPVYTDVLTALKGSSTQFKQFVSLLQTPDKVQLRDLLRDPRSSVTVLAPNNAGWSAFNMTVHFKAYLDQLLLGHFLKVPVSAAALRNKTMVRYGTYATSNVTVRVMENKDVVLQALTEAKFAVPVDIPVLYGRSYIHAITYPLVPSSMSPGGAAAMAVTSPLMVLASAFLATKMLLAMMQLHGY